MHPIVLICILLIRAHTEHLFIHLLEVCISSVNFTFHILCLFFFWIIHLFLLIYKSSLYIVDLYSQSRFYHSLSGSSQVQVARGLHFHSTTSFMGVKDPTLWFRRLTKVLSHLKRGGIDRDKCGWRSSTKSLDRGKHHSF